MPLRPYNISFHTPRRGHLRHLFLTKMSINMATAWLSVDGEVFPYWLHHGIPRPDILSGRLQIMGRRSSNSFLRYWCSLGEIALKLPLNHVWNLPAASIRSLGLTWELAFYAPSALLPGASWDFRSHPKSLASIHFFIFIPLSCDFLWFLVLSHALIKIEQI